MFGMVELNGKRVSISTYFNENVWLSGQSAMDGFQEARVQLFLTFSKTKYLIFKKS